ncbi:hypothetical protein RB594_009658 [Gaeumannomyces avenae]
MAGNGGNHLQVPNFNTDGPGDDQGSHRRSSSIQSNTGSAHSAKSGGSSHSRPPSEGGKSHGSKAPSDAGKSRPPSEGGGSNRPAPASGWTNADPAVGHDPARERDPLKDHFLVGNKQWNKNLDLPAEAYVEKLKTPYPRRPGMGNMGKKINVCVNFFPVQAISNKDVFLYDISAGASIKPEIVARKCFNSPTIKKMLDQVKAPIIYDGRHLAWSSVSSIDIKKQLDLDAEYGRGGGGDKRNCFMFTMRQVGRIRMEALQHYLQGKLEWDNSVLECLNFLDHVMRQGPSEKMLAIKRNFYSKTANPTPMGDAIVEMLKGTFASIRMSQSIQEGRLGLGVNVDVANTCFWQSQGFEDLVRNFIGTVDRRWSNQTMMRLPDLFEPVADSKGVLMPSEAFRALRKLHKIRFFVGHRGKMTDQKSYCVKRFVFDPSCGPSGANAKTYKFTKKTGETISIFDHFVKQYNCRLQNWRLPLIETTRAGIFPLEVCTMELFQRYPFKLDPDQTSKMIKFAVTRPKERGQDIMKNVNELGWANDRWLNAFGIKISPQMASVPARVIPNPEMQYQGSTINPGVAGRWDLRGKVFSEGNKAMPLQSYGVVVIDNCVDKASIETFMASFIRIFKGHGGQVNMARKPVFLSYPSTNTTLGNIVEQAYQATGNANKMHPQMLFFILRDKSIINYERIKKSADCRYGLVSQCLQAVHVRKNQPQYSTNVAMKVNAKLGGQTCKLKGVSFSKPTMMIGVDVSHASPGSFQSSMAAITVSMDKETARYAAAVETNGHRVEVLLPANVQSMLRPLITRWCKMHRTTPQDIFYFRDGVSDGMFSQVLELEVEEVRKIVQSFGGPSPRITVIVATKRHHIRFFPRENGAGDRNGNPLPGTVVEREVTHPFHYDFYLCSHVAIQGTARPVHYHVIHDEVKMSPDELQKMIYQQCYQYARSTTPVSLHPAVYYAHLASNRGRSHENANSSQKDPKTRKEPGVFAKGEDEESMHGRRMESVPLLPIGTSGANPQNIEHFKGTMWFI